MSYCSDLIQKVDSDRYMLALFAGDAQRGEDLCALFAFHYEIARIRESVTDTNMGLIRMQWWRDGLSGKEPSYQSDILDAVRDVIVRYELQYQMFEDLMMAREFDLEDVLPADMDGVEIYARSTQAPLMVMVGQVMAINLPLDLGCTYGLLNILRGHVHQGRQSRCYLPEDMIKDAGLRMDDVYAFKVGDELRPIAQQIAQRCDDLLDGCRASCQEHRFTRAMWVMVRAYLNRYHKLDYKLYHPMHTDPLAFRYLRVWLGSLKKY